LKQSDAFSPFFFICALEYAIRRVQLNQNGLKLIHIRSWFMLMILLYWA